ncbi:proton-conducting transporter transmembrane domain-containing protein [Gelatiniphilus marinus]|uniref:Proton-conducting transporter membrane subunit n=1 Tax=Gelatiniphilus marinus TaxID=1759464 RepID=A0ABW5JV30_9FLAO
MTSTETASFKNKLGSVAPTPPKKRHWLSGIFIPLAWVLFIANVGYVLFYVPNLPQWQLGGLIAINGLSTIMWLVVTFFSAIIQTYASNYLKGFKYKGKFLLVSFLFALSVMFFVVANNVVLFCASWLIMGYLMTLLIGINTGWEEAKNAARYARNNFIISTVFLSLATGLLVFYTNAWTLTGIREGLPALTKGVATLAALGVLLAALIQSAIFPFHRWLMSAMTSPTPASALMHAGFVNAAGILLTIFAPLLVETQVLTLIFIIGSVTAIFSQFSKLLQVNIKQKLACSTSAQMSFMIMQCGLGFFSAAITHLILHGFYKAYLFLSSGEEIEKSIPKDALPIQIKPIQTLFILVISGLGGVLFAYITGKGLAWDTGLFLTFIVAITVGQITYNVLNHFRFSIVKKIIVLPFALAIGIGVYALTYNGIALLLADMPMANKPIDLTYVHVLVGALFLLAFYVMLSGRYQKIPWLYVKLLNASQPFNKSVISYKHNRS